MSLTICLDYNGIDGSNIISQDLRETPTEITHTIINSEDPLEDYIKYVSGRYSDDSFLKTHIEKLRNQVKVMTETGFKAVWSFI